MEERILGRTGRAVSVVGLGTWQLGADWGEVDEASALAVLDAAAEAGVTFLDTADVHGDGRSERLIGQFLAANPGRPMTVATKMDHPAARRHDGYPRRPERDAGTAERQRRRRAAAHQRPVAGHQGHLRPAHPGPGATAGSR